MASPLSFVFPVCNAQDFLGDQVDQLLELLADLTDAFEILIVDVDSTDHTEEVARELEQRFPQVRTVSHRGRGGERAAIDAGIAQAAHRTVVVKDMASPLRPSDLRRLWFARNEAPSREPPHAGPASADSSSNLLQRLTAWGIALQDENTTRSGAFRLIRREDSVPAPALRSTNFASHLQNLVSARK